MTVLQVSGVHAGYGGGAVLRGLDLEVGTGRITALLGANGAGKTTTLRVVSGQLPFSGSVALHGRSLPRTADRVARRGVAHVPEGRGTFARLTVDENLRVSALRRRDRAAVTRDLEWCRSLYPVLAARRRDPAGSLSGGEQQMLAIARGLMSRPSVLLLDEPSLGLAPRLAQEVFATLPQLRDAWEVSILLVEQNAGAALAIADDAYVLERGCVAAQGAAAQLADRDDVRRVYLGL